MRDMNFSDWLNAERGRLAAITAHFGLTQSAVCQWRVNGVPPARMKAVRDFTGGSVTLEEMLPDAHDVAAAAAPALGASDAA
jgi:DNA-binding transcriptional regulator YdaS (Cro superfamily)